MISQARTRAPSVVWVAASDRQVHQVLIRAWDRLRAEDARIPPVVVDLTPGRPSSCTSVGWLDDPAILEVNLQRDGRNLTGPEVFQWLTHQAAHSIAGPVKASEGRYHPITYKKAAEALGLDATRDETGYGVTSLASGTRTRYRSEIATLDRALQKWTPTEQVKATRESRNGVVLECSCMPPRKIRIRGNTDDPEFAAKITDIRCERCGVLFS